MRDLGKQDNKATITDAISGTEIQLHYRSPKASELQEFYSNSIYRRNSKTVSNAVAARIAFALKIITGLRDGDFGIDGKPISSNPQSEDYFPEWKKLIEEKAADILDSFVFMVFENSRAQAMTGGTKEIGGEDDIPLQQSSND